jgi:hypothetical protein
MSFIFAFRLLLIFLSFSLFHSSFIFDAIFTRCAGSAQHVASGAMRPQRRATRAAIRAATRQAHAQTSAALLKRHAPPQQRYAQNTHAMMSPCRSRALLINFRLMPDFLFH